MSQSQKDYNYFVYFVSLLLMIHFVLKFLTPRIFCVKREAAAFFISHLLFFRLLFLWKQKQRAKKNSIKQKITKKKIIANHEYITIL